MSPAGWTINEPALNMPDGERNTTTPAAMLGNLKALLLGNALSPHPRARAAGLDARQHHRRHTLRAGLPSGWQVGDKTGHRLADDPMAWSVTISPSSRRRAASRYPGRRATRGGRRRRIRVRTVADVGKILAEAFA